MSGGGWDAPPPPANGGEFLLSLLQRPQLQQPPQQMQPLLSMDPAVAAVGPSTSYFPPSPSPWADIPAAANNSHIWANNQPSAMQWALPINNSNNNDNNQQRWRSGVDIGGNPGYGTIGHNRVHNHNQEPSQQQKLDFGSPNGNFFLNQAAKEQQFGRVSNNFHSNHQFVQVNHEHINMRGKQQQQQYIGNRHTMPSSETKMLVRQPPPGFSRQMEEDNRGRRQYIEDVNLQQRFDSSLKLEKTPFPMQSTLQTTSARDIEESLLHSHLEEEDDGDGDNVENFGRQIVESLLEDGNKDKKNHRDKDMRSDNRGQELLSHGMRVRNSKRPYRRDIFRLNAPLLAIYESLIPSEEEKAKQNRLFTRLEKLVAQEWREARLYLYGSCASSFGVLKSDIDVCLSFRGQDFNKSEVLLKLADILQSDNLQNVQALTRARVPIVKLMDPETGISCDICINNLLAVINTKLLRDYAKIDGRLRQLAFIVKHWAKTRGVNETYQGTLSSYAYVLMCIHFLQQRRPAILPCLQMMEPTFTGIVDGIGCAFYDRVERLSNYGSQNLESIAELVWGFFTYWAYRHDYTRDVISVRTGGIISKRDKDWTRRIGNDRHLICIEDPFEITHDLGRVVDKFSIKVLREEFERAAEILQFDPNPCVTLFEPHVAI